MPSMSIGLSDEQRLGAVEELNRTLANESVLLVKTKKFHWDVSGPQFKSLHELWDTQYATINVYVDELAERVRYLGGFPVGTMTGFLETATLKEHPGQVSSATESVAALLADHETIVRELRKRISRCADELNDAGSADFFTRLLQDHEKMAWMLRSFIEGEAIQANGRKVPKSVARNDYA